MLEEASVAVEKTENSTALLCESIEYEAVFCEGESQALISVFLILPSLIACWHVFSLAMYFFLLQ